MLRKSKVAAIAIIVSIILAASPAMILAQAQLQTEPAEKFVALAERASQQVQNIIDLIEANETAIDQIDAVGLIADFEGNVTLYESEGLDKLSLAQDALGVPDYEAAVSHAIDALSVFREVYSSIHVILEAADLQKGHLLENQGLLEAITRELERIDHLKEILATETPQEIFILLEEANELLDEAKILLLAGDTTAAKSVFLEAKVKIAQIYQYLKTQAEETNTWRLNNYCEGLQYRIQEKFRYCRQQGIMFTNVLQSQGYESEAQFMLALQNKIQTAENEQDFNYGIQECQAISQMVQQMEQALNQEISQHQGQYGESGSNFGYEGSGSGHSGGGGPGGS